jgi:hypothetical protein
MIKKPIGERRLFSGGAEPTVRVIVSRFSAHGSLNDGEKNLILEQGQSVAISVETLKAIIAWAEQGVIRQ